MGSIVTSTKIDKATGKEVTIYRAHIRRKGFASQSKSFTTRNAAKEWLRNNESEEKLKASTKSPGMTFASLADTFALAPAMRGTKYWQPSHLAYWKKELGELKVKNIARGDINAVITRLRVKPAEKMTPEGLKPTGKTITAGTVNRYIASLNAVFNFALDMGIVNHHPMKGGAVRRLKEDEGRNRILTPEEEEKIITEADASSWPMMGLFIRMMLTTAARKSEVLKLRWTDLDLKAQVAYIPKTKNGQPRAIPLVPEVQAMLAEKRKVRPLHSDFVFFDPKKPSHPKKVDGLWAEVRKRAGLWKDRKDARERVVLHTTRHTGTTKLIRSGMNLAQTARITGHKTLAMLKRYEHLASEDVTEMAAAVLGKKGNTAA